MHKLEALLVFKTKLAAIEQEHDAECAGNEQALRQQGGRSPGIGRGGR
jgi:hypothetical protein